MLEASQIAFPIFFLSFIACWHLMMVKLHTFPSTLEMLHCIGKNQHTRVFFGALHKFNARTQKYTCCSEGNLKLNCCKRRMILKLQEEEGGNAHLDIAALLLEHV
ncbi:hypothetical protein KP509_17G012700 [Ceratopteris richardii]|uniref:Uncharacterized protein n=1 Tax=Ceratopteris richardii TaxID=49495 RepID=A0A8T2SS50_CERRI|nr:hypothetical protein KP509_17G012700 [Ceratopteris richardii]